jgi:VIT1/CCC1 family predicted Fe2+/Mn2+ transporter
MSISIWMISMFVLGLVAMALCVLFLKACEKI